MDSITPEATMHTNVSPNSTAESHEFHHVLLGIYSVVFVSGILCFSVAVHALKSSATSITSIAVFNLLFTHFLFLLTVPFRIYYYATHYWKLGLDCCKVISSMVHIHMYMSFIFYVIILISRLLSFYKGQNMRSFQRLHALLVSAAVWILVLVITPCVVTLSYGKTVGQKGNKTSECFTFAGEIESTSTKAINYVVSLFIILATAVLTSLQANILLVLYKRDGKKCMLQQEFSAQLKSLCFALIMVASFIPYHIFRLYYIEHLHLESINEVFLSLTTFNCLDALTFMGTRTCFGCYFGKRLN